MVEHWGDLLRLQRLTCLVERTKERTEQCSCRLSGSSENRAFKRCKSAEKNNWYPLCDTRLFTVPYFSVEFSRIVSFDLGLTAKATWGGGGGVYPD